VRLRNLLILAFLVWAIYRLSPEERRLELRDRLRELGRALVISLVIYWIWLLVSRVWLDLF